MNKSNLLAMESKSNIEYQPAWADVSALHSKSVIDVSTGTVNTDFRVAKSLSGNTNTSCEFSFAVSKENLLGSAIWVKIPMTYTIPFTATSVNNTHLSQNNWCFSSLAMLRAMTRCAVTIGGVTIDRSSSQLAHICQHLFDVGDENLSTIYPMPDVSADLNTTGADLAPFGKALSTSYHHARARQSADTVVTVWDGAATIAGNLTNGNPYRTVITTTMVFPLPIDLFSIDGKSPGLIGCGAVNISMTFDQGMWRDTIKFRGAAASHTIGAMTVGFSETPTLYYNVISPHESIRSGPMKQSQVYPMNNYVIRRQERVTLAASTSEDVHVNSVNIGVIPRKLIICAPRVNPAGTGDGAAMILGDNYARISKVTVSFNGQNAFSSMSPEGLWQLSCKNGSNQNLAAFMAGGSVILSFENGDIGLGSEGLVVGSRVDATLSVTFTITNTGGANYSFDPYVCNIVQEHLMVDPASGLVQVISGVATDDSSTKKLLVDLGEVLKHTPKRFGAGVGSFFAGLGRGLLKAAPAVFNAVKSGVDIYRSLKGGAGADGGFIPRSNTTGGALKPKRGGSLDEVPVKSRIL